LIVSPPAGSVTWIRVERPVFDLAGVLTSSLSIAGMLAASSLILGGLMGIGIIAYRRRHAGRDGLVELHIAPEA
jgi:hypothetical protein